MTGIEQLNNFSSNPPKSKIIFDAWQNWLRYPTKLSNNFLLIAYPNNEDNMKFLDLLDSDNPPKGFKHCRYLSMEHNADKDFKKDKVIHDHVYLNLRYRDSACGKLVGQSYSWSDMLDKLAPYGFNCHTCIPATDSLGSWVVYVSHRFQSKKVEYDLDNLIGTPFLRVKAFEEFNAYCDLKNVNYLYECAKDFISLFPDTQHIRMDNFYYDLVSKGFSWQLLKSNRPILSDLIRDHNSYAQFISDKVTKIKIVED